MTNEEEIKKNIQPENECKKENSPLKDILIINISFWIFIIIQASVVKFIVGELTGIVFFFGLIAVGFTFVSLYDYIFTKLTNKCNKTKDVDNAEK